MIDPNKLMDKAKADGAVSGADHEGSRSSAFVGAGVKRAPDSWFGLADYFREPHIATGDCHLEQALRAEDFLPNTSQYLPRWTTLRAFERDDPERFFSLKGTAGSICVFQEKERFKFFVSAHQYSSAHTEVSSFLFATKSSPSSVTRKLSTATI